MPQLYVSVDREKAKKVGVPINDVFNALSATLGNYYVNDFNKFGRAWQVLMSADPSYRNRPDDIGAIYVRSDRGDMVPLNSLASVQFSSGPDSLDRFNNLPAVKIFGGAAPGISSGQAIARVEQIAKEVLPAGLQLRLGRHVLPGEARRAARRRSRSASRWSWCSSSSPRSTRSGRCRSRCCWRCRSARSARWPRSTCAASPTTSTSRSASSRCSGLAAKNAILIVEYAVLKKHEGMSASAAAIEAARLRFRPILMTSLAFIFGVLPLAISTGAGAGARHSTGTGVMGGMIAATFLAIFFVPLFYRLITDRRLREKRTKDAALSRRSTITRR